MGTTVLALTLGALSSFRPATQPPPLEPTPAAATATSDPAWRDRSGWLDRAPAVPLPRHAIERIGESWLRHVSGGPADMSPDAAWIATAKPGETLRVWNRDARRMTVEFAVPTIRDLLFRDDGRLSAIRVERGLVTGVCLWEVATGRLESFTELPPTALDVVSSGDGRSLAWFEHVDGVDHLVTMRPPARATRTKLHRATKLANLSLSHDAAIAAFRDGGHVMTWDVSRGQLIDRRDLGERDEILGLSVHTRDRTVAVVLPGRVEIYAANDRRPVHTMPTPRLRWIGFSGDGSLLFATHKPRADGRSQVDLLDLRTGRVLAAPLSTYTGSANGNVLLTQDIDGWRLVERSGDAWATPRPTVWVGTVSPAGDRLVVLHGHALELFSLSDRRARKLLDIYEQRVTVCAFTPDGQHLLIGLTANSENASKPTEMRMRLIDLTTGATTGTWNLEPGRKVDAAPELPPGRPFIVAPGGAVLAVEKADGSVVVVDMTERPHPAKTGIAAAVAPLTVNAIAEDTARGRLTAVISDGTALVFDAPAAGTR